MADDATRKLTFDASGAKQGAFDFITAGNQVIAANQAVAAAETKTADAINAAATRGTSARRAAAQAARDASTVLAAAAAAAGDAVSAQTDRIVTSTSKQTAAINRIAASFDPMVAAATRAQRQLQTLMDISAQGGPQAVRANVLMPQGLNRANAAEANLSYGGNVAATTDQLTAKFAPAQASAQAMTAELAQLNQALTLGIGIEGGYAAAWDGIVAKYDLGVQAATRALAAQQAVNTQAKAGQDIANSQQAINQLTGVRTSPGSVGGVAVSPYKSASDSAAVFQAQFDIDDKLAAENARLAATYDPLSAASAAYAASLADIDAALARNILSEGQAADASVVAANRMRDAQLAASAASANLAFGAAAGGAGSAINVAPATDGLTEAGLAVDALNAQMAELRATLSDGISNVGQYAGAWDRVSASMDDYIAQATRANAVTAEQIVQSRMAQDALNSQAAINQLAGVQTSPGSVGGVAVSPAKSAQDSFAVFDQAGMTADLDAQRKAVDSLYAVSAQYADQYAIIQNLKKQGVYNDAQEDVAINQLNAGYKSQIDGMNKAGGAAGSLSLANAGVTRELIVMGHEVLTGNYTRLGGSMLVIAERVGGLGEILKSVGGFLATPIGIGAVASVAVVAGVTAFAVAAEDAALRVERLQNALALVRPDFAAASQSAEQAAKVLAQTTFLSTADARTGTSTIYGNPAFQGTTQQAAQIATAFATLSRSLGENETDWKRLASAMQDPAATLQTLLDQNHLVGVNQALVNHAKLLQEAGDKADAFGLVLTAIQGATAGTTTRMTPLETALHDLDLAFVKTGQDGHSFAQNIGTPITTTIALVIESLASLITQLRSLGEQYPRTMTLIASAIKSLGAPGLFYGSLLGSTVTVPGQSGAALPAGMVPTTSYGGVAGGVSTPGSAGQTSVDASIAPFISQAAAQQQIDAELLSRLQRSEGVLKNGQWQTSPTGAIGPMQVTGSTFAGMQQQPSVFPGVQGLNDLSSPQQNVEAGAAYFAHLLGKYGDPTLAVLAYHDGETKMDAVLAGSATNSQDALDQARKVMSGYSGTGLSAGGTAAIATSTAAAGVINPEGGPTSGFGGGTGMADTPQQTIDHAQTLADTMGLTGAAAAKAKADVYAFSNALTLQPGNVAFQQGLQKANLELYNAVPAAAAALRSIDQQTEAETRVAAAWANGATAAAETTNQIKAETQATQFAVPQSAAWKDAVVVLTDALNRQAAATQGAQQAQQQLIDNNTIAYTQKEIDTLGMEAGARTAVLSALKAQQDAELKYAQNPAAQQKSEADAAAISKVTFTLQQNDAALSAVASGFSESFDTIGNAMTQSFLSGQGAAVNWANVMSSAAQQVLQQFMKLAVINPLLNSLGLGGANGLPTLETVGNAINQQAANGTGLGGMLNGTLLGNLLGVTASGATATSPGSLNANDLAFASGSAAVDLSQIPVPPIPPVSVPVGHVGWQVGAAAPAARYIHPAYFDDAPRFHSGMAPGLAADEFPAILQRGERVITAAQDGRVLDVMGRLAAQAQDAQGAPAIPAPAGQRDLFLPMLAHAEAVANAFHSGGVVGRPAALAVLPSNVFVNAPRLHDGDAIGAAVASIGAGSPAAAPLGNGGSGLPRLVQNLDTTDPIGAAIGSIPGLSGSSLASATAPSTSSFFSSLLARKNAATTTTHIYHSGGPVGSTPPGSRSIHPAYFDDAPRFHDGFGTDGQFSPSPAVPSEYDLIQQLMGPGIVPLPSGGFAIAGAPGAYPSDTTSGGGFSSILSTLGPLALPLAMLALKGGSLFSGSGLLSANTLNTAFGTTFGAGTFPTAANPLAIAPGYAADGFTPLAGAVAGVAPDAAAASVAADTGAGAAGAASSGGAFDGILSWFSGLFAHQGGVVGDGRIPVRPMSLANFSILPRFHDGLGADEFLTMLQPGHRVVTAAHQATMMQSATNMGVGPGLAAVLAGAPTASNVPGAFPAILQRGEKILGGDQQAAILALMGQSHALGAIRVGNAMPSAVGHAGPLPRFHEGTGAQDLIDILDRGDQAMSDRRKGATDDKTTNNEGHTINVTLQGAGNGTPDGFRRAGNQIARNVVTALARAQNRDS